MDFLVTLVIFFIIGFAIMFGARYMFIRSMEKSAEEKQKDEEKKKEE